MVTFKGANLITVTFQNKPHWPPGHRELAFLRTFHFHATTGATHPTSVAGVCVCICRAGGDGCIHRPLSRRVEATYRTHARGTVINGLLYAGAGALLLTC